MGDMADALINGDFDEQTGEWLGEGDGYPRTTVPGQYNTIGAKYDKGPMKDRWGGNSIHPIYNTILQLANNSKNPTIISFCSNKNGTISFLHKFLESIDVKRKRSAKWLDYKDVVTTHKKQLKQFIKEYGS